MRRLVCAFVVHKPSKTGFLTSRPISESDQYESIHGKQCESQGNLVVGDFSKTQPLFLFFVLKLLSAFMSAADIHVDFTRFFNEANNMNPDQTAPKGTF